MSFYLTLPSDSSQLYYPENKIAHFNIRLPQPLDLNGEWEVGLTELIYPHMWDNIVTGRNEYEFDLGNGIFKKAAVPNGYYETPQDIIKMMNYQHIQDKITLNYGKHTKRVKITFKPEAKLILKPGFAEALGFSPGNVAETTNAVYVPNVFESPFVADPNYDFQLLYIYTDIIEPTIVGDIYAPLLRVITVKGKDGDMIHEIFDRPHYIPLSRKIFQTIEIVIRTHTGQLVSFERGKLIVKLHLRQKYLS